MPFEYNPQDYNQIPDMDGKNDLTRAVFGRSRFDFTDSQKAAYDALMQRESNALDIALFNYENEYNSPLETMKRYQAAGINFMDALGKPNPSVSKGNTPAPTGVAHETQATANKISLANSVVSNLASIYDNAVQIQKDVAVMPYYKERARVGYLTDLGRLDLIGFQNETNELSQLVRVLDIMGTLKLYGIDLPYGRDEEGNYLNLLSKYRDQTGIKDFEISKQGLWYKLQKALHDLRVEQKETQKSTQSYNRARTTYVDSEEETKHPTGIGILDNILNKFGAKISI